MNQPDNPAIEVTSAIPENAMVLRAFEVVLYLDPESGLEVAAVRWQGAPNLIQELGMIEYAKRVITDERYSHTCEHDDEQG